MGCVVKGRALPLMEKWWRENVIKLVECEVHRFHEN